MPHNENYRYLRSFLDFTANNCWTCVHWKRTCLYVQDRGTSAVSSSTIQAEHSAIFVLSSCRVPISNETKLTSYLQILFTGLWGVTARTVGLVLLYTFIPHSMLLFSPVFHSLLCWQMQCCVLLIRWCILPCKWRSSGDNEGKLSMYGRNV